MALKDKYLQLMQTEYTIFVLPRVSVTMTPLELMSFFKSRNFFLFLVPLMLMLTGATPSLFAMPSDGLGRAVYWLFCLIGYLGAASLMMLCQASLCRAFGIKRYFAPITSLPLAYVATSFADTAATTFFSTFTSLNFFYMPLFFPQYMLIIGLEVIVFAWVLPPFLARSRGTQEIQEETAETPAGTGVVSANGQSFLAKDIVFIQANQHYVTLRVGEKEVLVRSTFKGIISQLPQDCGLQVHRSFWVSGQGVDVARSLNEPGFVVLECGQKIAVARSRQCAVRSWLTDLATVA